MNTNDPTSFFNQQYGFSQWKNKDKEIYDLSCDNVLNVPPISSPMFACKNAEKSGNEHIVAMANEDGQLVVLDSKKEDILERTAHPNAIFDLAWMFKEMKIATASGDHSLKLWDLGNGYVDCLNVFYGHTRSVKTVTFQKDDDFVFASGGRDGLIMLWDTRTNSQIDVIGGGAHATKVAVEVPTTCKETKKRYANSIKSITGLVFQNQNTLISCGAGDGYIKIWDLRKYYSVIEKRSVAKHKIPHSGNTARNGFSNLLIDNAGIKLYANCLDNTIYCYNISSYNIDPVMTYIGHRNSTFYIKSALSMDEDYLVSGSSDNNAYIWNLKYSKPLVRLTGHLAEVTCVAWCNKDNSSLLTCSDDMTYKYWSPYEDVEKVLKGIEGKNEILPLPYALKPNRKRQLPLIKPEMPKKFIWQCQICNSTSATNTLCEYCEPVPLLHPLKRRADDEMPHENKRILTERGPKNLFIINNNNYNKSDCFESLINSDTDGHTIDLNAFNAALHFPPASPTTSKAANKKSFDSPTANLPNYVVDGLSPHLNFSPPKKRTQDWLTKLRVERNLRQRMLELSSLGPTSPKRAKVKLQSEFKKMVDNKL